MIYLAEYVYTSFSLNNPISYHRASNIKFPSRVHYKQTTGVAPPSGNLQGLKKATDDKSEQRRGGDNTIDRGALTTRLIVS